MVSKVHLFEIQQVKLILVVKDGHTVHHIWAFFPIGRFWFFLKHRAVVQFIEKRFPMVDIYLIFHFLETHDVGNRRQILEALVQSCKPFVPIGGVRWQIRIETLPQIMSGQDVIRRNCDCFQGIFHSLQVHNVPVIQNHIIRCQRRFSEGVINREVVFHAR